jgi:PhzF family phenazine biosynthesis protein
VLCSAYFYDRRMRVRIVDAFTNRPFAGNPAAVCLVPSDGWPGDGWLRNLAGELNTPMVAYLRREPIVSDADWAMRWFLPSGIEEILCGHATLAAAHVLSNDGEAAGVIRFRTRSGILSSTAREDGAIALDFPAAPVTEVPAPENLGDALGAIPLQTYRNPTLRDLLAVFDDEGTVRPLTPNFAALAGVTRRHDIRGVVATAAATAPGRGYDFVSRFFSPADGIPEDHVTGSAHTALAPYWSQRLGRNDLTGFQASARTGVIRMELRADRVDLIGHAVTVLDGTVIDPP